MKKKLLSLLTLLTLCVAGAWAETVVTNPTTEMVNGTYITMQCMDTNGGDEYYFDGNAVKSETRSFANIYKIVSNGADAFYLQRVSDSKYVGKSGDAISMVDETTSAAAFTFSIATATGWTTYDSNKYTNGTSTVRFTTSGTFLNTQAKAVIPKYAGGTGGYSIWYVKTYTQNEVDKMNPALLTFSEVKDGYTYAIVNVQPSTVNYKKYYLNNANGELTPVDATDFNNTSVWDETAQFIAVKQADGKFAFKNKANNQYLAWRAHGGRADLTGENSNKGLVDNIEKWSSWTMNKSSRAGFEGTYFPSCTDRNATTVKGSTLLVANDGTWNAWGDTECTTNNGFSNNYGFVELAAPTAPEYTITFNFTGVAEGTLTTTVRGGNVPTLPVAIPSYVNYSVSPELTAVTGDATYTVNSSYQESFLPFEPNGDKFYTIKMNRSPNKLNIYVDPTDNTIIKTTSTASAEETREYYQWNFGGNWLNGFSMKNKVVEKFVSYGEQGVNNTNNKKATLVDAVEPGATFDIEKSGNYFFLKIHGSTSNYISNNGGAGTTELTTWNSRDYNDGGSQLIIEEAADLLTEAKNTAIASLPNHIPVLFDYAAGVAAINAATNVEGVNTAKENYLKSAEGKKFSIKSTQGSKNYVDASGTTLDATSTTLNATGVYEVKYVEGTGQYNLFALKNQVYVKNNTATNAPSAVTANAEEAGVFFIGNVNGNDNDVYFTKVLSGWNAIHYNSNYTGHNCVWTYDAGASQWTIETITDEQWKELIWKDLENAITTAEQYSLGTGLGQYTPTSTSFIGALLDAKDMLQTHKETPAEEASIEQVQQAIASIAVSQLSINQPQPGMLLRFKGNVGGKYVSAPETESTAKANMVEGKDDLATVFTLNEDDQLISCTTGTGFINTGSILAPGSETTPHKFTFSEGTVIGTYVIQSNADDGGQFWYASDAVLDRYSETAHNNKNFIIEEADEYAVADMEITEVGTATFCAPFDVEIPEGVTAYTATIADGSWVKLEEAPMLIENGKLEAGTPVVLKGAPMHKTFIDVIDEDFINTDISRDGGCLSGNLKKPRFVDAGSYLLQNQTAVAGLAWYKVATSGVLKIGTNRCYMTLTSGQNAREYFPMDFDDPTGINTIATEAATKADGKYLVKGQIVVVKAGKAYTTAGQLIK